jgi:tRNA/tmRNA/rRNA uracil-C5-methylase (TrmA/RlmC/RlmD family)
VTAVESSPVAGADAAHNLADLPQVGVVRMDVLRALASLRDPVDVVVLDPPRSGAGAKVVGAISGLRPRAVAYVACDPAALARDVATFADAGYRLADLRAFDIFPQTHHVECVAILARAGE